MVDQPRLPLLRVCVCMCVYVHTCICVINANISHKELSSKTGPLIIIPLVLQYMRKADYKREKY